MVIQQEVAGGEFGNQRLVAPLIDTESCTDLELGS